MTAPATRADTDRPAADRRAAVDAYVSGQQRLIEIAAAYQVTSKTVLEWVRQAGRPLRGNQARDIGRGGLDLDPRRTADPLSAADPLSTSESPRYQDPQRAVAVAAYLSGTSIQEIVAGHGVPRVTLVAWLRAAGVPIRAADGGSPPPACEIAPEPVPTTGPHPAQTGTGQPDPARLTTVGGVAVIGATAERGRIEVRWEAHEPDVRGFHVEVSRADKKDWRTAGTTDAGQTTLEWRKAKKGKEYRFRVRATTTAGPGPWSRPVKVAAR